MTAEPKFPYRVRNWSQYAAALKQRGSLSFWIDEAEIEQVSGDGAHDKRKCYDEIAKRGAIAKAVELFLKCAALNRMIQLGKPDSY